MGKTHLLEGIYRSIRAKFPALRIVYLTAETFGNYFTEAMRDHTMPSFRQRFRHVDVLLIDDVEFFEGKNKMQEEFLHTFQQLEGHQRQIVLTGDRHPRLFSKISEELSTRFLSGLVCRVESPDQETRERIVSRKSEQSGQKLAPDVRRFVAQRFRNNVRELEGALNCLETYRCMIKKRVNLAAARRILSDLERDCIRIIQLTDVESVVCDFFGVPAKDLKSSRRHRSVSEPRMLAMYLSRQHTRAAYSEIGQYFGGRNHSTVMSAEKKVREWLAQEHPIQVASETLSLSEIIDSLEQRLKVS